MSAAGLFHGVARGVQVRGGLRMTHAPACEPVRRGLCNSDPSGGNAAAAAASVGARR